VAQEDRGKFKIHTLCQKRKGSETVSEHRLHEYDRGMQHPKESKPAPSDEPKPKWMRGPETCQPVKSSPPAWPTAARLNLRSSSSAMRHRVKAATEEASGSLDS